MAKKAKDSDKAAGGEGIRLSAHPRARRGIAMAKGWGGLGVFGFVLFASLRAGVPLPDALLRGMLGGIVGFVVAWLIAVNVWRQIALAELEGLRRRLIAEMEAQAARADASAPRRDPDAATTA